VSALNRKLLRDLIRTRGQACAVAMVLACGIATMVMSLTAIRSLTVTMEHTYERGQFAQVFAYLKRAPLTLIPRLSDVPGIARIEPRLVTEVNLDMPAVTEPVTGRLISIPEVRRPMLNDLHLRRGRWIEPGRRGEILISEAFAEAHELAPGSQIRAVINGRGRMLSVVGVALSPEFIYEIREGELLPDPLRFGVLYIGEPELAAALDMTGAFNSLSATLLPGASSDEVIRRIDTIIDRYGSTGAFSREDQTSHRFLSDELDQLQVMATVVPVIFFAVAVFLLHMVLSRQIATQREQIAALKAFGYTNFEVGRHYLLYVLAIAVIGVIIGTGAGLWLGHLLTGLYARFYRFATFEFVVDPQVLIPAALASIVIACLGSAGSVRRAMRLPPAEAMRPEPPGEYRATMIERLGVQAFFTQVSRMVLRHIERKPGRSLMTIAGMALATAVMILGTFTRDVIEHVMDEEFRHIQGQDVTITFNDSVAGRAEGSLRSLPGVLQVEGFRALPARLRFQHRVHRIGITGLAPDQTLIRALDPDGRPIRMTDGGILLSEGLAERLHVTIGDRITAEILEHRRPIVELPVAGLVRQYAGNGAWISLGTAHRIMGEQDRISAVHARVDSNQLTALYGELKRTPAVAGVLVKSAALQSFRDTIAENIEQMRFFNVLFASIITFGVVYNAARITLAERSRELATLRVIGFSRGEVSSILIAELGVLTLIAVPIGLVIGYFFAAGTILAMQMQEYRFPLIIAPSTYGLAAGVVLTAALISSLIVRRRIDRLDLVAVLKAGD